MTYKILIIDDEESIRNSFSIVLSNAGFAPETAENGQVGVDKFTANQFDLIFLDLKMPVLDGIGVLKKLHEINSKIPVFVVTAFSDSYLEDLKKLADAGMNFEVLQKPVGAKDLVMASKSVLEGSQTNP